MLEKPQIPRVLWAQERATVLLTVAVPDLDKVDVKFEENSVSFSGQVKNVKDSTLYAVKIDLYGNIDQEGCKYLNIGQKYWRILLKKKDTDAAFWPRLTKDKTRLHWLQTDFDHWKEEDESDDEKPGFGGNFGDMFSGGMGGMDGMDDMPDMDGDSDDDGADEELSSENDATKTLEQPGDEESTKSSVQESTTGEN